jgi:predicted DNA-binding protein
MRSRVYTMPFTLFMPADLLTRLKTIAARDYKTQSEYVRESVLRRLEQDEGAAEHATHTIPSSFLSVFKG